MQRTSLVTQRASRQQELVRRHPNTAYALNRLDDNGSILLRAKLAFEGLRIIKVDEGYIICPVGRCLNSRVIRQCYGHTCATVKGAVHSQDTRAARRK